MISLQLLNLLCKIYKAHSTWIFKTKKTKCTVTSIQYLRVYWGKQFALQFLELFWYLHFKFIQQEQYILLDILLLNFKSSGKFTCPIEQPRQNFCLSMNEICLPWARDQALSCNTAVTHITSAGDQQYCQLFEHFHWLKIGRYKQKKNNGHHENALRKKSR